MARLARTADRWAAGLPLLRGPLAAEDLLAAASRRTGLDDFGDEPFFGPLQVLLRAYDREAALSLFGRLAARWDTLRFLANLLRLRAEEKAAPLGATAIDRPVLILGMPRSGTTFLHALLAQDPASAAVLAWQTVHPYPLPGARRDRRPQLVQRGYRLFRWLAPEVAGLHPIDAREPQECGEITAHLFTSLRYDTTHQIPSYREWLDGAGHLAAYRFHRRFLQHLQRQRPQGETDGGAGTRWVLKCPDHVFALPAIRAVYPDARLIFVHRDPLRVLASVARLTEALRQPFTCRIDRAAIGRQVSDRWADGARRIMAAADAREGPEAGALHLRYRDLVADPLGTVAAVYRHFGMTLTEETVAAMRRFLAARPRGGYGINVYRMEEYGLEPTRERRRFGDYITRFSLSSERQARVA